MPHLCRICVETLSRGLMKPVNSIMTLLPFDPLSPRSLSLVLLGLIVLVTMADSGPKVGSLTHTNARYVNCYGVDGGNKFRCPDGGRNSIAGGHLSVGKSF